MTKTQKEIWEEWTPPSDLVEGVKLLFEILDSRESSDSNPDRDFHPTYITSCRVWDTHRLHKLLPKLRELSEVKPYVPLNK